MGSSRKVWWIGSSCRHEWEAPVKDRTQKDSQCPVCANRKVVIGVNDLSTTHPDLAALLDPSGSVSPSQLTAGSRKRCRFVCPEGHRWSGVIATEVKKQNGYCPPCSGYVVNPGVNDMKTLFPRHASYWNVAKNGPLSDSVSPESHESKHWVCPLGHEFEREIRLYCKSDVPCPVCSGKKLLSGFNDLETLYPEVAKEWHPTLNGTQTPRDTHPFTNEKKWFQCSRGHSWRTVPSERFRPDGATGCPECAAARFVSKGEQEVADFVRSLGLSVRQSVRSVLPKPSSLRFWEVDILVEEQKVAIEFNGLYYHSDRWPNRGSDYHFQKHLAAQEAGYLLIQIWEDDWKRRRPIVESMLRNKLDKGSGPVVYARKTEGEHVSAAEAKLFLDQNHIQGYSHASKCFGLRDGQGELVAVLAVKMKQGEALIARYATSCQVPGGFTKLLKVVERSLQPERFVTFSDNCISDGGLYASNGFIRDTEIAPDYFYFYKGERHHKFTFRKARFREDPTFVFQDGATERELAEMNGLFRVWDAGKVRWVRLCTSLDEGE